MSFYDEIADGYNTLHGKEQIAKVKIALDNIKINPHMKLLDVGCGTGISTNLFNCNKTGIDPSKELLKKCTFPTIQGYAENLPFDNESFDLVISFTAIHNFNNVIKSLKEMQRVGKKLFIFSILKKASKFDFIRSNILALFKVEKELDLGTDVCFICDKL